jgi:hypothetical protein
MELSPFLSVSVRVKNHFMKCRRKRMANLWRRWEREKNVQWVQRSELRYNKSNQDIIEKSKS